MPKPGKKGPVNQGKQVATSKNEEEDNSCISFGAIPGISNNQLAGILESSKQFLGEGHSDLTSNPDFMKSLNAFATQKSQEIMESSVNNLPSTSGPQPPAPARAPKFAPVEPATTLPRPPVQIFTAPTLTFKKQPSPPPQKQSVPIAPLPPQVHLHKLAPTHNRPQIFRGENLFLMGREFMPLEVQDQNPEPAPPKRKKKEWRMVHGTNATNPKLTNGGNGPYYAVKQEDTPAFTEEQMMDRMLKEKRKRLEFDEIMRKKPDVIAKEILKPKCTYSFIFSLEMYMGNTGMSQNVRFVYSGSDTFSTFKNWFRKKYTCNNNFLMFYLDHNGQYFEVYDDRTLKMLLITHGAFPRGFYCSMPNRPAKVFCVPVTETGENHIAYYMQDLVLGVDADMLQQSNTDPQKYLNHLPRLLMPDLRYAPLVDQLLEYTKEDLHRYCNGLKASSILQLIFTVQQKPLAKYLFKTRGNVELCLDELELSLEKRYEKPYIDRTPAESVNLEVDVILENLWKSKHQTKGALEQLEGELKKEAARIILEQTHKNVKKAIFTQEDLLNGIKHIEAKIEKPPSVVAPPVRLFDLQTHPPPCQLEGFKEVTVEHRPNPGAFQRHKKVLEDPTGRGFTTREVFEQTRQFARETGVFGDRPVEKPIEEEPTQKIVYCYHPKAAESENDAISYLDELNEIVEKNKVKVGDDLERARKQHKQQQEKICIDDLVGEDDGPELKTIDEDDETSSHEPSPILQDQPKVFVLLPTRAAESSDDEECPDLIEVGPLPPIKIYRGNAPNAPIEQEENVLQRSPSQENVTITNECLNEEKISKTIIKVGMDKPRKEPAAIEKVVSGQTIAEIRPSAIKNSISQEEEFKTPLGSVSSPPEGFLRSSLLENAAEEDIETFQDCEEELSTPTKQSKSSPPVPTSEAPEGSKSPIVSVKLALAGQALDVLKSLDSPALSTFKSTREVLQQTSNLLSQSGSSPVKTESALQRMAMEKAEAMDIQSSQPEDPSLSRVQTEEELRAQEEEQKANISTTPKAEKLKTA